MYERDPLFTAMTRSTRLLGLPYDFALLQLVLTALPLIWIMSVWSVVMAGITYVILRIISEGDDKWLGVLVRGKAAVPPAQNRTIFGGDSYGP